MRPLYRPDIEHTALSEAREAVDRSVSEEVCEHQEHEDGGERRSEQPLRVSIIVPSSPELCE